MFSPESLEPADGPNGEKGAFKPPKDMSAVFGSMMQPGLIDFKNPGFKESFKAAETAMKDKKEALKTAATDAAELLQKYDEIDQSGCNGKYRVVGSSVGGVDRSVGSVPCVNCKTKLEASEEARNSGSLPYPTTNRGVSMRLK